MVWGFAAKALPSIFGGAARSPLMATGAAVVADQTLNDGNLTSEAASWLGGQFVDAVTPENGGDWIQLGVGLMAGMSTFKGNIMSAVALSVATYFMDDILEFADKLLERNGIDIIPDEWYQDEPAASPAAAPAPANPSMS